MQAVESGLWSYLRALSVELSEGFVCGVSEGFVCGTWRSRFLSVRDSKKN